MSLPSASVNKPITTAMIFTGILIFGIFAFTQLAIDLLPVFEPPAISVITLYPGAGAEDVELKVSKPIEERLSTVSNVTRVTSSSKDNISAVTATFAWGTNLDEASNNIRDVLEQVKPLLPTDAERPMIFKFSSSNIPVVMLGVTAEESYPALGRIVSDQITDALTRLPGVGTAYSVGGPEREFLVRVDPSRLQAYGLTIPQLAAVIGAENITMPAGQLKLGRGQYNVRVPAEFGSIEELRNVVVSQSRGSLVYLKDVAQVQDTLAEQTSMVRLGGGKRGAIVFVLKQSGTNSVQVANEVRQQLDKIQTTLPSDVKLSILFDTSDYIKASLAELSRALVYGAIFVVLVVAAFLRRLRGSLIIILTIPVSLVVAFIYLYISGNTINVISLSSLAIAVGMVVDDAIVILENITRHIEEGEKPKTAAVVASNEVGLAVMASTLTIVAVFLPIAFVSGIAGIFVKQLGFLVTFMIVTSLFAALSLSPMLASKLLRSREEEQAHPSRFQKLFDISEQIFRKVESGYGDLLTWALHHKGATVAIAAAIFLSSAMLFMFIGTEFIPSGDTGSLQAVIELPVGTNVDSTTSVAFRVQDIMKEEVPPQYRRELYFRVGQSEKGFATVTGQKEGPNIATVGVRLVPLDERGDLTVARLSERIRKRIAQIPAIVKFDVGGGTDLNAVLFGGAKPLQIEIYGESMDKTLGIAERARRIVAETAGAMDASVSWGGDAPEFRIVLDRNQMTSFGLNASMVAAAIRSSVYGLKASEFREVGQEYDIFIQVPPGLRNNVDYLKTIPVKSMTGQIVPLQNFSHIEEGFAPIEIQHKNKQRVMYVGANIQGRALGDVINDVRRKIRETIDLPPDVEIKYGGQAEEQSSAFRDLLRFLVLSIILVYMVMAAQFESLLDPFVIMFSVPFAFTGIAWALLITGTPLSLTAFIGMILLIGIVVKNGIVLVDYTNILRARRYPLFDAVVQAGKNRLRPVLMTSFTTVLGNLPLALSKAEGSEFWKALGIVVVGGLTVSTLVTLVIVPTVYSIFEARAKRGINRK